MRSIELASLVAIAACTTETTSFRPTDRGDASDRAGPLAAAYVVGSAAQVHVWSNGGYIGSSDEPMTHVAFEIRNTSAHTVVFDGDRVGLALFDQRHAPLPAARFVTLTPIGPARVPIASGATAELDAYFLLPVRPRVVESMRLHWTLLIDDERSEQLTTFVRDD
jgi:hypothetical protein